MDPIIIVLAVLCVVLAIAVVVVGILCKKVFFQRGAEHRKQIAEGRNRLRPKKKPNVL